jgi:hypothetical protein
MDLPKVVLVRDAIRNKDLDAILVQTLSSESHKNITLIANDNCQYSFYLQGGYGNLSDKGDMDKKAFQNFLNTQNVNLIEQINEVKVRVYDPEGHERSKNFKAMIDFSDAEDRICLIDGKWFRYNQSFLNFLRREADTVSLEKSAVAPGAADEFFAAQVKAGFIDCRKAIAGIDQKFRVNKLDLYKDGTLYFVKLGAPESVNYTVDQAINAIKFLQAGRAQIELDGQTLEVERIGLWLDPEGAKNITRLSEVTSLNFLMKIADWKRAVLGAGFRPRVRLGRN